MRRRKAARPAAAKTVGGPRTVERTKRLGPEARPTWQTVCDGRRVIGRLLSRGKAGVEAFDAHERSLGVFSNLREAADAVSISAAKAS
jgi:hypothetical protein